jgi:hypothetical protein
MTFLCYNKDTNKIGKENVMSKNVQLKTGDTFLCNTHAEFLNEVFGTDYVQYMRCSYPYMDNVIVWMVRVDGKPHGAQGHEFKNYYRDSSIIQEKVSKGNLFDGEPIQLDGYGVYRLVFDIVEEAYPITRRRYVFKGVYKIDSENSKYFYQIYEKVSDEFPIKQPINIPKQEDVVKQEPPAKKFTYNFSIGDKVEHKTFGTGSITNIDHQYITVGFMDKEVIFVYPDCFDKSYIALL